MKTTGVSFFMQNWFDARCAESNKRHVELDEKYALKIPYIFEHLKTKKLSGNTDLNSAIASGAVVVGRGSRESNIQDDARWRKWICS